MKKYMILLASAMIFAACSNDEPEMWNGEIRLRTTTLLQTRAAQDIQSTQFEENETVYIYLFEEATDSTISYDGNPYSYIADGSGGLSCFPSPSYPANGNDVSIYGLYPSNITGVEDNINGTGDSPTFTVQTDQSTDANYKKSDLMLGYPEENPISRQSAPIPMTFQHMLSKININVTAGDGLTADSLAGATVTIMNTIVTSQFDILEHEAGPYYNPSGTAPVSDITAGELTAENEYKCSAIIVPQTIEFQQVATVDFIKITLASGTELTYKLTPNSDASFDSGYVYNYAITAKRYGLDITTTITDWVVDQDTGERTGDATN